MGGRRLSPSTSMAQSDPIRLPASPQPWDGSTHHWALSLFSSAWRLGPPQKGPTGGPWEPPASRFQGPRGLQAIQRGTWPKLPFLGVFAPCLLPFGPPGALATPGPPWPPLAHPAFRLAVGVRNCLRKTGHLLGPPGTPLGPSALALPNCPRF